MQQYRSCRLTFFVPVALGIHYEKAIHRPALVALTYAAVVEQRQHRLGYMPVAAASAPSHFLLAQLKANIATRASKSASN